MIDINAALGMTSERPLQVCETCNGTGVEVTNEQYGNGTYIEVVCECRLVDPPRERDEVAELRERLAIAIADRDSFMESYQKISESMDELKQQLSQVTRERDEYKQRAGSNQSYGVDSGSACGRNYLSVCGFVVAVEGDTQRDSKLASRFGSPWNKDAINYVVEQSKEKDGELVTLREQLATVQAEAAAMRRTMTENESRLKDVIRRIGVSTTTGWITHELNHVLLDIPSGTAGRELLDRHKAKLAAKDAEIEQERKLSRSCMSQNARLVRKSRTAKTALFEHYRGKIDPAWFGEKSELYKYRTTANPSGVIWRTSDGKSCKASMVGHAWITATAYSSWQECCDDKRTYPCNADGTPLAKSDDDAALLRKLRELLQGKTISYHSGTAGVCVSLTHAQTYIDTLIAIRDGGK